ncbi:glucose 1-dehydrogenase [Leptospira sp. 201903074]|uniref:SDR family NAD(P)-dependent oxidoreductase n=1 Tax=Leptospira abararensis TaxID=2810036 RepID=UPI0019645BD9|nr:glucose 1-dehydrogenase [Leptospira abararensis]MBM9547428.1 glucose 1-dehydrogenase [Leptospira abararensis]
MSLKGKTAVVTGGSQGIGAGIVKKLASQGANVFFNYNSNKEAADKLAKELEVSGSKVAAIHADVTKVQDLENLFEKAAQHFGKLDILVNNAGVFTFSPAEDIVLEEVQRLFNTNVFAPMFAVKYALKHFNDGGSIINMGSIAATWAPPNFMAYASTKAAIDGITKVLSKELAPRKITVNQINPGSVRTEGNKKAGMDLKMEAELIERIPLGRIGFPDDIANLTAFLVSDDARWITGEVIMVSGGMR